MRGYKQRYIKGTNEVEARAEEMLEVPLEWNEVPDLMMEEEDVLPEAKGSNKRRRDEISRGGPVNSYPLYSLAAAYTTADSIKLYIFYICICEAKRQIL